MSVENGPLAADDETLLSIRAQVMVVDEQTALWRLYNKGDALSSVTVNRNQSKNEYYIQALRISDGKETLRCYLQSNLQYHVGNTLFHHWSVGSQKYGLSFKSLANAVTFEKLIKSSIKDLTARLLQGSFDSEDDDQVFEPPVLVEPVTCLDDGSCNPPVRPPKISSLAEPRAPPVTSRHNKRPPPPPLEIAGSEETPPPTPPRPPSRSVTPPSASQANEDDSPQLPPRSHSGDSNKSSPMKHKAAPAQTQPITKASVNKLDSSTVHIPKAELANQSSTAALIPKEYGDYRKDYYSTPSMAYTERQDEDGSTISSLDKKDTLESQRANYDNPPLPTRKKQHKLLCCFKKKHSDKYALRGKQLKCQKCQKWFSEKDNYRGACTADNSTCSKVVSLCTCSPVLHSCLRGCSSNDVNHSTYENVTASSRRKRIVLHVLLGLLLPCVWCYYPCNQWLNHGRKNGRLGASHTASST